MYFELDYYWAFAYGPVDDQPENPSASNISPCPIEDNVRLMDTIGRYLTSPIVNRNVLSLNFGLN